MLFSSIANYYNLVEDRLLAMSAEYSYFKIDMSSISIQEAYDNWSAKYDLDTNLTRDLDRIVTIKTLASLQFKSIVEIGCGTGKNTDFLSQIGLEVRGIDFSPAMIDEAKKKTNLDNVTFSIGDITKKWMCSDRYADLITCNLVLEHIQDLDFVFSEVSRVLTDNGVLFICELHPFKQYLGAKANFEVNNKIVEIRSFVHHISEFLNTAKNSGFIIHDFQEWWHEEDRDKPPRLTSFIFKKQEYSDP